MGRDVYATVAEVSERKVVRLVPEVTMKELLVAFKDVLRRAEMFSHHHVQLEPLSVRQRMADVLARLQDSGFLEFTSLFTPEEGRRGVVVTFLAMLELLKQTLIELVQAETFGPIHVKAEIGRAHV